MEISVSNETRLRLSPTTVLISPDNCILYIRFDCV